MSLVKMGKFLFMAEDGGDGAGRGWGRGRGRSLRGAGRRGGGGRAGAEAGTARRGRDRRRRRPNQVRVLLVASTATNRAAGLDFNRAFVLSDDVRVGLEVTEPKSRRKLSRFRSPNAVWAH